MFLILGAHIVQFVVGVDEILFEVADAGLKLGRGDCLGGLNRGCCRHRRGHGTNDGAPVGGLTQLTVGGLLPLQNRLELFDFFFQPLINQQFGRNRFPCRGELTGQCRDTQFFLRERRFPRVAIRLPANAELFEKIPLRGPEGAPLAREVNVLLNCVAEPLGVASPGHPGEE